MSQKIALKKLTASDLTFFDWHYRNHPAGKQKAINLNADVFIQQLYPNLPSIAKRKGGKIPLDLYVFGPGLAESYNLQRKIVKSGSYKNWRLNGELIYTPDDEPERFTQLQPDDFVIFEFFGDLEPNSAKAIFVAAALPEDAAIHQWVQQFITNKSMVLLQNRDLHRLVAEVTFPDAHPINNFVLEDYLEDAALGGIDGIKNLRTSPYKGKVSQEVLERARENAKTVGVLGEELVNLYLESLIGDESITDFVWASKSNAISPFDFTIVEKDGSRVKMDVKSTKNNFESWIHVSFNELLSMVHDPERYDLYRVFDIDDKTAKLKIAKDVREFARKVVEAFEKLPDGVKPDGVSIAPAILNFKHEVTIEIPSDFYGD